MVRKAILFAGAAALVVVSPAMGRARPGPTHPVRTVQLITMAGGPTAAASAVAAEAEALPPPAALATAFRVHDLDRRWVEYQMAESLATAAPASSPTPRSEDPFAPQARAADPGFGAPATTSLVPVPRAPIAVPGWMRPAGPIAAAMPLVPGCAPVPYRPSGFLGVGAETRRQTYYAMMSSIACEYGVPVGLFDAMIIRESGYDPASLSPKNAFGLTQLMPATAAGLGVDRFDVAQNLRGGASYLRQQLDRYGQFHLALAAYNAGPGRVRDAVPATAETQAYVDDILHNWSRLTGLERDGVVHSLTSRALLARTALTRGARVLTF